MPATLPSGNWHSLPWLGTLFPLPDCMLAWAVEPMNCPHSLPSVQLRDCTPGPSAELASGVRPAVGQPGPSGASPGKAGDPLIRAGPHIFSWEPGRALRYPPISPPTFPQSCSSSPGGGRSSRLQTSRAGSRPSPPESSFLRCVRHQHSSRTVRIFVSFLFIAVTSMEEHYLNSS